MSERAIAATAGRKGVRKKSAAIAPKGKTATNGLARAIAAKLKAGPEQQTVVRPLVARLAGLGWSLDRIVFGKSAWRVPKAPAESNKRERGRDFDGFPVDIAVFSDSKHAGITGICCSSSSASNRLSTSGCNRLRFIWGLSLM